VLAGGLGWADPTDLDRLREDLKLADPEGRLAPIGMSRVEIGPQALGLLYVMGVLGELLPRGGEPGAARAGGG